MINWKNTFSKNKNKYLKILERRPFVFDPKQSFQNYQEMIDEIEKKMIIYQKKLRQFEQNRHQIKKYSSLFVENEQKNKQSIILKNQNKDLKMKILLEKQIITNLILKIPNFPHSDVPDGKNENDNQIVFQSSLPKKKTSLHHWDIGVKLNYFENQIATKMSKTRFVIYKKNGAKLIRGLTKMMLDEHQKNGYQELVVPQIVKKQAMEGTGQLPKMKNDCFEVKWSSNDEQDPNNFYLLPTSEVALVNYFEKKTFFKKDLPQKFCAYSLCFRKEAGAAGKDNRGLIRLHQFHKVELVKITTKENSYRELEKMCHDSEQILKLLNINYRKIILCTADLGFSAAKTYDLEVWMPNQKKYLEIASISNTESFQTKYLNIKYQNENGKEFAHALNGSALAIDRLIACLLETYYDQEKNEIQWPSILKEYLL